MTPERTIGREAPLRVGVVGLGWLGTDLARQCHDHERTVVTALTDTDAAQRRRLGDELDIPTDSRYDAYDEMLADEPLDAVVITTPHRFHYEQIVAALEADCHVLCEKPLCIDIYDAIDLEARVESTEKTFMLGYQRHLKASFQAAREHLQEGAGSIQYVDAGVTQPWTDIAGDGWRANADVSGGGVFYDTGNHLVDGVLWATDLVPESVTAEMAFDDADDRVDVVASVSVTFENGAVGSLSIDGTAPCYTEHNRVWTDDGGVVFDEEGLVTIDEEGTETAVRIDRGTEQNKVEAFVESIETGVEPPATVEHGRRAVALTEAAYEAARTGRRIEVDR